MSHGMNERRAVRTGALLIGITLAAGCSGAKPFVYQPSAARADGTPLPVKVGVLPFQNGTEDFERRGSVFQADTLWYNLARTGISGTIEAVTPALWARAFASELSASGRFAGARFAFDASELAGEDYVVDGTVLKAYVPGGWKNPSQFEVALHAVRRKDGRSVWERTVSRSPVSDRSLYDRCGASIDCMNERAHAELNRTVQEMLAEAGADLAKALGGPSPGAAPRQKAGDAASPAAQESVEDTVRRIMEGK